MKHIDEHTLELLVLGDPIVRSKEAEIRAHLVDCIGCNAIYEEMRSYYEDVKGEFSDASRPSPGSSKAIAVQRKTIEPYFEPIESGGIMLSEVGKPTLWHRLGSFGRGHPVMSSSFAAVLLALLVFGVKSFIKFPENPSYYYYNTNTNAVDIYSSSDRLLWSINAFDVSGVRSSESYRNVYQTIVADLNRDGKNEVITTVLPRRGDNPNPLRMFDWEGNLVKSFIFKDSHVTFKSQDYTSPFDAEELLSVKMPGGGSDLFVYFTNGRSPSFLARLDGSLKVIGKYWHYGNFLPFAIEMYRNGIREIAITGTDDMNDMDGGKSNFLAILDPSKIIGDMESGGTRGFGFKESDAELYYIRFPKSDIETAEAVGGNSKVLRQSNDSLIHVRIESVHGGAVPGSWGFEFLFNERDMSVNEVKFASPTPETFETLKKEGKVHGVFDTKYLQRLKEGVEYWDGMRWVKRPAGIPSE